MVPKDLAGELTEQLVGFQRVLRRRLRSGLAAPRLRGAQVELLRLVSARPGIRVSAAAEELFLADNSVSTLVNQLVRAGLLGREPDPLDRRAALLYVTPSAVERLRAWDARRSALVRERFAALTEEDRAALAAALPALRRLTESLRQDEGPQQEQCRQEHAQRLEQEHCGQEGART
ncbi:MarR family winged helix-turn-helix transcriptional regulator [Saccharothrix sp. ST-888]|uniref:MarR family winged helix-turn-helix transcriptional regulator n=1 Tax=Saccharothrix sp. ST-888 TaxID=1427391 RepID=UPI0007C6ACBB|nr:MarR family transcriptional regulator [Saccharothrix sp. ST-888]